MVLSRASLISIVMLVLSILSILVEEPEAVISQPMALFPELGEVEVESDIGKAPLDLLLASW